MIVSGLAYYLNLSVRAVINIGGQDSKAIILDEGDIFPVS